MGICASTTKSNTENPNKVEPAKDVKGTTDTNNSDKPTQKSLTNCREETLNHDDTNQVPSVDKQNTPNRDEEMEAIKKEYEGRENDEESVNAVNKIGSKFKAKRKSQAEQQQKEEEQRKRDEELENIKKEYEGRENDEDLQNAVSKIQNKFRAKKSSIKNDE